MRAFALFALAAMLLAASPVLAAGPLAVGDQAPDFTLADQHGQSVRLSEVLAKRRHVVLAFYVQAFTPG